MEGSENKVKRKSRAKNHSGWNDFETTFSIRRPMFISHLVKAYPILTKQEIRVCAMLCDFMSSNQIAMKLNIDERTVENHRTKIRRKLGLSHEQRLENFLISF
jgi:DNA-binding CsgD family transcriptional regulator